MLIIILGLVISIATAVPVFWQMRKHPAGLHVLFFAEMWERFSYYGMRALLVFYVTQHFMFTREEGNLQYGTYTSLIYLMPLVGGYLADRYLGSRKAIAFGALLLVAGHCAMAVEGKPATAVLKAGEEVYAFETQGRGEETQILLNVDGTLCAVNPQSVADMCAITVEDRPTGAVDPDGAPVEERFYVFQNAPSGSALPPEMTEEAWFAARDVEGRSPLIMGVFYLALSLIVMGVGFLKSNISAIVGDLYEAGDPRRDPGFTLYYFGINLGAFWASILCGALAVNVGWWAGFGLAGVGMIAGYLVFVRGRFLFFTPGPSQLPETVGRPPDPERLAAPVWSGMSRETLIYIGGLAGVIVVWFLMQRNAIVGAVLSLSSVVVLGYLGWLMATRFTKAERERLLLALILIGFSVVFWTLFEQAGSSLNLFAQDHTQLKVEGVYEIEAAQTQSFNSAFILIFAPVFAALWAYLGRLNLDPNPALKFGLALIQVGGAFFFLVLGSQFLDDAFRMPLIFLALAYLVQTTGELFLSPVGLSMITRLSPATVVSTVMAVWFLSSSWAQYLGGIIASLTAVDSVAGQVLDKEESLRAYLSVYSALGFWTVLLGGGLCVASFWLKRLGHGLAGDGPREPRSANESAAE